MSVTFAARTSALRPGDFVTESFPVAPGRGTDAVSQAMRTVVIEKRSLIQVTYYGLPVTVFLVEGQDISGSQRQRVKWAAAEHTMWEVTR